MRSIRKTLTTLGLAAVLVAAGATAAQAAPPSGAVCSPDDNRVKSCFVHNGDDVWVKDTEKDGRSAVARWWTATGQSGNCRNANGYGTWKKCDYNLPEKRPSGASNTISWENWTYDGDTRDWNYSSGSWSYWVNGKNVVPV